VNNLGKNIIKTIQIGTGWFPVEPTGLNRVYYNIVNKLPSFGISVNGFVAGSNNGFTASGFATDLNNGLTGDGIFIENFAKPDEALIKRLFLLKKSLKSTINAIQPDLFVTHFALYSDILSKISKDIPRVMHFHGPWALEGLVEGDKWITHKIKHLIEKRVYSRSNKFIVLSKSFQNILHKHYSVPLADIHIIPGGVNVSEFKVIETRKEACQRLKLPYNRPIIVTVRRLTRRMGLDQLIKAIRLVKEKHPDILLLIGGRGEYEGQLIKMVRDYNLEDSIRFYGRISDELLPLFYRSANISIVPSLSLEGFGLTTIESLAVGTPVLVTNVGGLPEIVNGLDENLVIENSDSSCIAAKIISVIRDDISLPKKDQCIKYVEKNYDWQIVVKQISDVYKKLVK